MSRQSSRMIEALEPRQLLSAAPAGPAFAIGINGSNRSSLAADANGDLVAVWSPYNSGEVLAQRFQPNGTPIDAAPLVVSTNIGDFQRVAVNATGSFVVTWDQQAEWKNGGGYYWQVHARAFNASTGTFGSDTLVGNADYDIHYPSVGIAGNGQFVVAWRDTSNGRASSGSPTNVYARLYSASGMALGKQFQVNTFGGSVVEARAAMDSNGDFVIGWHDSGLSEAFARQYNAGGVATSGQLTVGADASGGYNAISATIDSAGDFLIAWQSSGLVYAQRYSSSGAAQWANPLFGGDGTALFVYASMDATGNAVVAWQQKDPIQNFDLYEQQFDSSGATLGGVENVTPYDPSTGGSEAWALEGIAAQPNDGFAITWTDNTGGLWGQQYIQQ